MTSEKRTVVYDADLKIEAYHFEGIMQKFPNHFHEHYVIGYIEKGSRHFACGSRDYQLEPGDLLLLNPGENHTCEQCGSGALDYRCLNIRTETMERAAGEITGRPHLPSFQQPVVFHSELVPLLKELHIAIMQEDKEFGKEELFFFLLEQLIGEFSSGGEPTAEVEPNAGVASVCAYLEQNYRSAITLGDLSELTGLSKYYLLHSFTKQKGISPYSYLITLRINAAKAMLEQGANPIDAALQTGFADQSHFSNFFKKYIGLTPRQYARIFRDAEASSSK